MEIEIKAGQQWNWCKGREIWEVTHDLKMKRIHGGDDYTSINPAEYYIKERRLGRIWTLIAHPEVQEEYV